MKKIIQTIYIFSLLLIFVKLLYAEDLRDFKVGASIELVPERGYVNLKCEDKTEIFKWINFKECKKNSDTNLYIIGFEYDERYAVTEEFEGTQVAGHPVIINIAIDEQGILQEININTDPTAPFYFRKQSHLLWLRVHSRYGSQGWQCKDKTPEKDHIKIGKKYINNICVKPIENKLITIQSQFYFIGDKSSRDNLVSKSYLQIKLNNKV
jgi:hypothetical protein